MTPPQVAIALLVVVVLLGVLGSIILVLPKRLAPDLPAHTLEGVRNAKDRLTLEGDRRKLQNDVRTGLLQGLGGAALVVGLIFTWIQLQANQSQLSTQQELTRRGQFADRFTKAVDQLGNARSVDVRLGGIYGLEQVARDFKDDQTRLAVYEVLTAYVRAHAVWDPNSQPIDVDTSGNELEKRSPDVQAAMTVLGRRKFLYGEPDLDLHDVDLRHANLAGAHLEGAFLRHSHLEGADLAVAYLENAALEGAHLERASLIGAQLERARLEGAWLNSADLKVAFLRHAHFERASLVGAQLGGARLDGARLDEAHVEGAFLCGADLSKTSLLGASLAGAHTDNRTIWPTGFDWRAARVLVDGC